MHAAPSTNLLLSRSAGPGPGIGSLVSTTSFYGKYRGVVTANDDPLKAGRIRAQVRDVPADHESAWASACLPCGAGATLPALGAPVWIEFEQGDPHHPIWTGCWWPAGAAVAAEPSQSVVAAAAGGHTILIDESPDGGGITLRSATGATVSVTDDGIVIDNGAGARITLIGPQVSVNNGALEIT